MALAPGSPQIMATLWLAYFLMQYLYFIEFTFNVFILLFILKGFGSTVTDRANTLQRINTENSKQTFPEKELRGLSPNSTFMCLWSNYIFPQ